MPWMSRISGILAALGHDVLDGDLLVFFVPEESVRAFPHQALGRPPQFGDVKLEFPLQWPVPRRAVVRAEEAFEGLEVSGVRLVSEQSVQCATVETLDGVEAVEHFRLPLPCVKSHGFLHVVEVRLRMVVHPIRPVLGRNERGGGVAANEDGALLVNGDALADAEVLACCPPVMGYVPRAVIPVTAVLVVEDVSCQVVLARLD